MEKVDSKNLENTNSPSETPEEGVEKVESKEPIVSEEAPVSQEENKEEEKEDDSIPYENEKAYDPVKAMEHLSMFISVLIFQINYVNLLSSRFEN